MDKLQLSKLVIFITLLLACSKDEPEETPVIPDPEPEPVVYNVSIPMGGNSWIINNLAETSTVVSDEGLRNWRNSNHIVRVYFYVNSRIDISLGMMARVNSGSSKVKVTYNGNSKEIDLSNTQFETIDLMEIEINETGYHYVDLQGLETTSGTFAEVNTLLLAGNSNVIFIKDDFYFGRRGPSVHLGYQVPTEDEIEWFYNEIEVPTGEDVIGSYFMSNGFNNGYFGIQVNSESERRVLFSVWSPFQTDDPTTIPEEYKIKLLKKGDDVVSGEFGNEGSGGQSYKIHDWKAGVKYGFLLQGKPAGNDFTDYTAYFHDPELDSWQLIASFRRPKTNTYLTGLYSFLENFIPNTGAQTRSANYLNHWVRDVNEQWHAIDKATFTADATARKEARLDYQGSTRDGVFYLKNCGFFSDRTALDITLSHAKATVAPAIDFSSLD